MAGESNTIPSEVTEPTEDALAIEKVADPGRDSSSSLTKMLSILDLFTPSKPIWSTNDLIQALATSRSTGYRYIKALNTSGLLSAVDSGYYVPGPRIIELDLQIRTSDPLLQSGKGVLEQLVDATGHSALLCMLFRAPVLCIRESLAPLSPENMFSRGQRRPLFKGAVSKVILAYLPNHRLRSIFAKIGAAIAEGNLGTIWAEFRDSLAKIRKDGHVLSVGEFNLGIAGVSAPIFNSEKLILGSVGVAWHEEELRDVDISKAVVAVKRAAREISHRLLSTIPGMDMLPRAVG